MNPNDQMAKNIEKFETALKPLTPTQRKETARRIPKKTSGAVELGYPANLAKFCLDVESIPDAPPLERLLKQTIKNCRRLHQIKPEELQPYARGMTEFPMLISLKTSQSELRLWLEGIKLSADRGPAYRPNAHWIEDEFSAVAEEVVFRLWGTAPCKIDLDLWKVLQPGMRLEFKDYLSKNPVAAKKLEEKIGAERDNRSPGPLRGRVIDRLLDSAKNFFDLRAQR
jgi:hypothetical protein